MDPDTTLPAPDPRARWILLVSSAVAVLVMGGLVGLAVLGSSAGRAKEGGARASGLQPSPAGLDPVPMPVGCVPDPARPPKLVMNLEAAGVDFGKVKQGQTVERRVTFRSTGEGPLCIRDVQTGCGCVKAHLDGDKRRYEPGEGGTIVLVLDTTGRHGIENKAFSVVTNELDQARRTWPVKADVSLGVIASSHVLDFGRPRKGAPAVGAVRLSSPKADPEWTVTEVLAGTAVNEAAPAYTWELKPIPDPNLRILELRVTHPGRSLEGLWRSPVVVKLTHPDRTEVSLEGQMLLMQPVQATPPQAIFGYLTPGVPARQMKIHLRPATQPPIPFQVTGLRVDPPTGRAFDGGGAPFVVAQGAEADGTLFVTVNYDGKARQPGLLEAQLVVSTSVPEQPELKIQLRATIAGSK